MEDTSPRSDECWTTQEWIQESFDANMRLLTLVNLEGRLVSKSTRKVVHYVVLKKHAYTTSMTYNVL